MNKKELEKKKKTKKQEKQKRKDNRKVNSGKKTFDDMIAYVDENGLLCDTPPDPDKIEKIEVESIAVSTPKREDVEDPVLTGRVEYYNADKGYGFIKETGSGEKYFFHINNAPQTITGEDMVNFELERGLRGLAAVNITIIK